MATQNKKPQCIGIIMDGNRRWAKEQGLPSLKGHERGYEKMREMVEWAEEQGVTNIIFYAFSAENWKRDAKEVSYLMDLILRACDEFFEELKEKGYRVRFAGEMEQLPQRTQQRMKALEEGTSQGNVGTIVTCISYGGRQEILTAVNMLIERGETPITDTSLEGALYTALVPDPDIIIRTGGDRRLSNFLPWQSVYSELFFIESYWPAFSQEEFRNILNEYGSRERRFGK